MKALAGTFNQEEGALLCDYEPSCGPSSQGVAGRGSGLNHYVSAGLVSESARAGLLASSSSDPRETLMGSRGKQRSHPNIATAAIYQELGIISETVFKSSVGLNL